MQFCLCPPDSVSRNGTKRKQPADGQGSGAVAKRREVKRSRTGRRQAISNGGGSLRFSAGFGETSGEARCGKSQSADDLFKLAKFQGIAANVEANSGQKFRSLKISLTVHLKRFRMCSKVLSVTFCSPISIRCSDAEEIPIFRAKAG